MPPPLAAGAPKGTLMDGLRALRGLIPYLWPRDSLELRLRVIAALALLAGAKAINIAVPFLYKHAVDTLSGKSGLVVVPVMLIVAYGMARGSARRASTSCATPSSPRSSSVRSAAWRCRRSAICMRCRCAFTSIAAPVAWHAPSAAGPRRSISS